MKIVATSDTHYPVNPRKIPDGDVFIHAGDLMRTGYPDEWPNMIEWLAALPHKIKIYVPGNHDFHVQVYPGPALQDMRNAGVVVLGLPNNPNYQSMKLENGMSILGLPYVLNLDRWAFNIDEYYLAEHLNYSGKHDIIVSHSPVLGILDGGMGIELYRQYLEIHKPKIWINGHIHEEYGHKKVDGCDFYNVAMCNRVYKHANKPVVIDI